MIKPERHMTLAALWLFFAFNFCVLASFHYRAAGTSIPDFEVPKRPEIPGVHMEFKFQGVPLDKPLEDFTSAINKYARDQNDISRQSNMLSFWGYVFAALTAVVSAGIEFLPRDKNNHDGNDDSSGDKEQRQGSLMTRGKQSSIDAYDPNHGAD